MDEVKISKSNSKLGKVWNISVAPVQGCMADVPCAKECYAMKAYRQYPATTIAWNHNLILRNRSRHDFYYSVGAQIKAAKKKPELFRWYVSGDIQHHAEIHHMYEIAIANPETTFLLYTKNYKEVNWFFKHSPMGSIPINLAIYFSTWPGLRMENPYEMPLAIYVPKGEHVPLSGFICPGGCDKCRYCFDEKTDVYFPHH